MNAAHGFNSRRLHFHSTRIRAGAKRQAIYFRFGVGNGLASASSVRRAQVDVSSPRARASLSRAARSALVNRMRRKFSRTSPSGFFGLPMPKW
jgi:hypothetical protein